MKIIDRHRSSQMADKFSWIIADAHRILDLLSIANIVHRRSFTDRKWCRVNAKN